ncbi:potassium-transporting ATPase subunit C [Opitutaceae bacterium EW11]|nr:potassium-transporting ATPase subunit C [Opitutaceae bacterium EW11]
MKSLLLELRSSLLAVLTLGLVVCGAYPVAVWGAAQLLFKEKADGSLIRDPDGTVRGSALLGQPFSGPSYFHPRPSAAGTGYDGAYSGGTNLGPTSKKLADAVEMAAKAYRAENGLPETEIVPADAVTSSGSGLDPHISPSNAELQVHRVAQARSLPADTVRVLVAKYTEPRSLNVFGEPGVNVLLLNRALDALPKDSGTNRR